MYFSSAARCGLAFNLKLVQGEFKAPGKSWNTAAFGRRFTTCTPFLWTGERKQIQYVYIQERGSCVIMQLDIGTGTYSSCGLGGRRNLCEPGVEYNQMVTAADVIFFSFRFAT